MDLLKEVIAQKRKQVEDIAVDHGTGSKMVKRADLFKKEREAYLEKQRQLELEQQQNVKGQSVDDLLDAKLSADSMDSIPRAEVIRRLRARGQPILLFGETEVLALRRLRRLEIERPDLNEGWKNDFQAALSQVEKEEVMEQVIKGTRDRDEAGRHDVQVQESEDDATWEQIVIDQAITFKSRAPKLGSGDEQYDCELILAYINYILKKWGKELNSREESVKRSVRGKLQAGMHKQTVDHLAPLTRSLEKYSVNSDIRIYLTNICNYLLANNAYMEMAIGNAAWPVGVTRSGIHQRPGSAKAYVSSVAHVMNDETQRKYIHGLKRVLSKAQEFFPTDPSKCVEFVKNKSSD